MASAEDALRNTVEDDGGGRWQNQQQLAEELGYQTALLADIGDKSKQKVPVPLPMKGEYFNLDLTEREAFLDLLEKSKAADKNIVSKEELATIFHEIQTRPDIRISQRLWSYRALGWKTRS